MRVNVGRISRDRGGWLELDLEERFAPLETPSGRVEFTRPVRVTGTVTNSGKCLVVAGTITTEADLTCHRCLEHFRRELEVSFEAEFFRQNPEPPGGHPQDGVRESLRHEEEVFLADNGHLFRGEDLELTETVRGELSLGLPMQNLCRETCAGLCPQCGANLNTTKCACERDTLDPRLSALQGWLDRQNSGREV
jgi:uncharacterized protein